MRAGVVFMLLWVSLVPACCLPVSPPVWLSTSMPTCAAPPKVVETPSKKSSKDVADAVIQWTASSPKNPMTGDRTWYFWCLMLVWAAYDAAGYSINELDQHSAFDAFCEFRKAGAVIHDPSHEPPPRGALVFWDWFKDGENYGHVVISNGDGTCVSTCHPGEGYGGGSIRLDVPLDFFETRCLGWIDPIDRS